nr:leucine-rich repeat-containing protein [Tanacetum cinerariifolium]
MFSGNVPIESFSLPSLQMYNQLAGQIDVGQLTNLTHLDLASNNFSGELELDTLLSTLTKLKVLDLSYSGFSVTTKNTNHYLRNLDLSGNEIHGQIPHWAGEIGGNDSVLDSLDLSHNFITGLPQFQWHGLLRLYLQSNLIEGPFPPLICNMSNLMYLDMSNNRFGLILNGNQLRGELPSSLSKCSALRALDLGNNYLNGTFPSWLGGEIPQSLARITTLEVLNLSQNHLVGRIPEGPQFSTFDTSFGGNSGLYGSPLPKREHQSSPKVEDDGGYDDEEDNGFTWKVVTLGYGCGTLVGLVMGYLMLSTRKVKWFNAIADAAQSLVLKKKRRHIYIGK